MQQWRRLVGLGEERNQLGLPSLQPLHVFHDGLYRSTSLDCGQQLRQLALDLSDLGFGRCDAGAAFHAQTVHLLREHLAEAGEHLGIDQSSAKGVQHAGFQLVAANVDSIVAGALVARCRTTDQLLRDGGVAASAAGTFGQTREQVFGAATVVHLADVGDAALIPFGPHFALAGFHDVPEVVIEDAQLRRLLDHPFLFRVGPSLPLAGIRVFDEALAIPDDLADIHLVVKDAVPAFRIAVDGAETPMPTRRGGNTILVQGKGDGLGRFASRIVTEDAAHDIGLRFVDGAVTPDWLTVGIEFLHHIVAVGIAAAGLAGLDAAALPSAGLVGQILQEQRIHRALEPDMQLADLTLRQGEHLHVGIAHALVDAGDVFLVTADPVQCLGQDHVEPASRGIHDQRLDAGTLDHAGA